MLAYGSMRRARPASSLTDVPGFRVGHSTDSRGLTGCTVVLCGDGAVPGIDVRGLATGLRDPSPCEPAHLRSEEHTSELQSRLHLVCRLLLEKKKNNK